MNAIKASGMLPSKSQNGYRLNQNGAQNNILVRLDEP
jgi:hypothetical protein